MSIVVGIDLGTTHTLVAVLDDDGPRVVPGPDGSPLIPSAVALDDDGLLLVGAAAAALLVRSPSRGARFFKREMGGDRRYALGDRAFSATELSSLLLREAREAAERALGAPVARAVISVPAYFQEPQRAATREAAELAGLEVVRIVNEPTAAAIAHGVADPERERRVAVLDLGGGTFDVTLLDIFEGVIEVVGTGGDARLGGEDFTDALWRHACNLAGLPVPDDAPTPVQSYLRDACEQVKRTLTDAGAAPLALPRPDRPGWETATRIDVDRAAFEALVAPLLDRVAARVRDTLTAARRTARDVDEIVLAGGATRMPAVRRRVQELFGREALAGPDPDLAVALGAALQAGLVTRHPAVREVVVTDVLAHSLGVEIAREGEDRLLGGYFLPVLHRNTTLPARRVERVWTVNARQKEVKVRVYQGEHRYSCENRMLGELSVADLPAPMTPDERVAIDISFAHDLNGLLEVEATVVATGKRAALVVERQAGRMTLEERARALEALARLKVYPRELLPNRLVLEEALTRHARLPPERRRQLDPPLFAFEDALERQDLATIDIAREALRRALADPQLGPEAP